MPWNQKMYGYGRFCIFGWVMNNVVGHCQKQKRKRNAESFARKHTLWVWIHLFCIYVCVLLFFFGTRFRSCMHCYDYCSWIVATTFDYSPMNSALVHCSQTHKLYFSVTFSLKMGHTALFTNLKIILLQCCQFSVSAK